ncbi:S-adenosyl-L-methionine-dependent methyltransferases superfamily protein [Euphorbia peplus]|nr:S-adenosyl-L-methionine-dependent methyltransferases superfamily protein [Euphorbia peplus]
MEVAVQVLHMNGGEGAYSYYNNSLYQKKVILTSKPILEESISELVSEESLPECLTMADFGCSSGPNTLIPLSEIIEIIDSTCSKLNKKTPNLQYILNDLPGNDFNTIFKSLIPDFHQKLQKEKGTMFEDCLITAMPGSFYGKLFPSNSLHFVHSSSSLHWLSQIPEGLINESGIFLDKDNICLDKSSSESVQKAYMNQFDKDFTKFLRSRAEEMVTGGNIVITFIAKSDKLPYCKYGGEIFHLIRDSLKEMVIEGVIKESKLDNFNVPFHAASQEQVRNVIEREGSLKIKGIKEFELSWDANVADGNNDLSFDSVERSKYVANYMRAAMEPMLATHFGDVIIDNLFYRFSLKVVDCLEKGIGFFNYVVVSMTKTK